MRVRERVGSWEHTMLPLTHIISRVVVHGAGKAKPGKLVQRLGGRSKIRNLTTRAVW